MAPLSGIEVIDFSTLLPGPLATLLLAEVGATVIKIERPGGGDEIGFISRGSARRSVNFASLNRGKRSVELDLKAPASREPLERMLARADVLVEQFRPGVMERLGLGYDAVAAINPRLVYCSITGYGSTGPRAGKPGHDLNYVADAGLLDLVAAGDGEPVLPPVLVADIGGGRLPGGHQHPARAVRARPNREGPARRGRDGRQRAHLDVLGDRRRSGGGPLAAPGPSCRPADRRATSSIEPRTGAMWRRRRSRTGSGRTSAS